MRHAPPRVYADTSVFGGVFDARFAEPSRTFFEQTRQGRLSLVASSVVVDELVDAPPEVQRLLEESLGLLELVDVTEDALRLHDAYLEAEIVALRRGTDALHVAVATVSGRLTAWP